MWLKRNFQIFFPIFSTKITTHPLMFDELTLMITVWNLTNFSADLLCELDFAESKSVIFAKFDTFKWAKLPKKPISDCMVCLA